MLTPTINKDGSYFLISTDRYSIRFDVNYANKRYPVACIISSYKLSDKMITDIESSKIVTVDTDMSGYSLERNETTLLLVPQPMFTTEKLTEVLFDLIMKLDK